MTNGIQHGTFLGFRSLNPTITFTSQGWVLRRELNTLQRQPVEVTRSVKGRTIQQTTECSISGDEEPVISLSNGKMLCTNMISPWVSKINERSNFGLMSPPVLLLLSKQIKGFPKGWNLENWCPSCPGGDNSQVWKQKSQKSKPRQLKYQTFQTSGNRNWYSVTLLLKRNLKQIKFSKKPEMVSMYPISGLSDLLLNTRRWSKTIIDYRLYRYHL